MPDKRDAEGGSSGNGQGAAAATEDRPKKRSRFGAPVTAPPDGSAGAALPAAKPAVPKLDVLEKAKKALQLQKNLQARLKNLPIKKPTAPAAAVKPAAPVASAPVVPPLGLAAVSKTAAKPAPLILDESGREVDAEGKPLERKTKAVSTFKINLTERISTKVAPEPEAAKEAEAQEPEEEKPDVGFDPRMGGRSDRKKRDFKFVQEGVFQRQAELTRIRQKYGVKAFRQMQERQEREKREAKRLASMNMDVNAMPLGERPQAGKTHVETIPEVEWWDAPLLRGGTYESVSEEGADLQEGKLTIYVEHPVPIEPPLEAAMPAPQPLKLTKVELKKLRTQRRRQREMEKQELIRQGLLEPAKPKVKISNLMRVLGSEATADPTAIEKEVRAQMAEREEAHEDRNLSRMLTPAERKEKKMKKLFGDMDKISATIVAVFRVQDLTFKQHLYKVDINAQENRLTGIALTVDEGFSLVVVEGGAKGMKRYMKLMLRRIDWNPPREDEDPGEEQVPNSCTLVWQGEVADPAFEKFTKEVCSTKASARKILEGQGVGHYWDLAENWQPETGI